MLQYDFEESVGYWVCMTAHALRRGLNDRLAQEGITLRQFEVLAWLSCDGDVSQAQLAECMGIEPPTLAGVLRRMERDGWVVRESCPQDRRKNLLHPTEKAEEIWERALSLCHEVREQAISGFTAEELETLKNLCAKLRGNLGMTGNECIPCEAKSPETVKLPKAEEAASA